MISNHTTSIEIKGFTDTQGFFSFEQPEMLIVFVHGFSIARNTLTAWNEFPSFVIFDEKFKKSDIIFYGYDTLKGQAGDHAAELYKFLKLSITPVANNILPTHQNLPERTYTRILLVAHSLGAVLVREAQLLAFADNQPWVKQSELALFAPAHNGAHVISLIMESFSGVAKLFGIIARFRFPILMDLDTKEEGILQEIKSRTESLQRDGKGDFTKAKLVVYAKGDKVVKSFQYLSDKPAEVIPDVTHTSVCKPREAYLTPLELLKKLI